MQHTRGLERRLSVEWLDGREPVDEPDLPILEAIARLEEGSDRHFGAHQFVSETGLGLESVEQSLRRLEAE